MDYFPNLTKEINFLYLIIANFKKRKGFRISVKNTGLYRKRGLTSSLSGFICHAYTFTLKICISVDVSYNLLYVKKIGNIDNTPLILLFLDWTVLCLWHILIWKMLQSLKLTCFLSLNSFQQIPILHWGSQWSRCGLTSVELQAQ